MRGRLGLQVERFMGTSSDAIPNVVSHFAITLTEKPIVFCQPKMLRKRIKKISRDESDILLFKNAYDEVKLGASLRQEPNENDRNR
ncbi:hypothetical protein EVAR_59750_1 [Eumeta japonica]|uniref:Uncharacterized protein n=1 Tax=Eumeta variegata TaxID=151549 RepID=A0A4C1Z5H5_EUMVA|nr:hypothetical protein EVAR_59750_1 [Eumeta japonica]